MIVKTLEGAAVDQYHPLAVPFDAFALVTFCSAGASSWQSAWQSTRDDGEDSDVLARGKVLLTATE